MSGSTSSLEGLYGQLSDEQKEQLKSMSSQEVIQAAIKQGVELSEEQLDELSGGFESDVDWNLGEMSMIGSK